MDCRKLSCKREPTNRADRFTVEVTKDSSQLEVATSKHLHTMTAVNSCRSGVGYGMMYATVTQSVFSCGAVMN